jgi:hypothetical protein
VVDSPASRELPRPADRVALRTMAQRRRRVWRNIILMVVTSGLVLLLSVIGRDEQSLRGPIQDSYEELEYARAELQDAFDRGGLAPPRLPLPPRGELPPDASPAQRERFEEEQLDRLLRYTYNQAHRWQGQPERPAFVCYNQGPLDLFLREDRRHLILFDGTQYTLETLTESAFRQRAAALGVELPE